MLFLMPNKIVKFKQSPEGLYQARQLYHIVGAPTVKAFKAVLKANLIKNCPVTAANVTIAEKIYGLVISTLKGKSTRRMTKAVITNEVAIPPELVSKH